MPGMLYQRPLIQRSLNPTSLSETRSRRPVRHTARNKVNWAGVIALGLVVAAFTVPVWRSGLRANLTFFQFVVNHTIWGPPVEYIPEEDYTKIVGGGE